MFVPYQVDVPMERWPISNFAILLLLPLAFALQFVCPDELGVSFVLTGWSVSGFLGHMWVHSDIVHLLGNMIFLWVFGNAVCAKVGNAWYPLFYVGLGVIAAATHLVASGDSMIGASGAINGVVGMYLVLYPLNSVACFLVVRSVSVSGFWIILLWFAFDVWGVASGGSEVAYFAHIGGFVAGLCLAVLLLKIRFIEMSRDERSLLQLFFRH